MKFDEWFEGSQYTPATFDAPPKSFDDFYKRIYRACMDAWNAGLHEGKLERNKTGNVFLPDEDEPTVTESKISLADMFTDEQLLKIAKLLTLPFHERLKRSGLEYEDIETPHGTLTILKNKYFDKKVIYDVR